METTRAIPYRLEPFGHIGYTVKHFASDALAAAFVQRYRGTRVEMPCWQRFAVNEGKVFVGR